MAAGERNKTTKKRGVRGQLDQRGSSTRVGQPTRPVRGDPLLPCAPQRTGPTPSENMVRHGGQPAIRCSMSPQNPPRTWSASRWPVTPPKSAPMMAVGNTDPDRRAMDDAIAAPDSSPARPIVRKKGARRGGRGGEVGGGGSAQMQKGRQAVDRDTRSAAGMLKEENKDKEKRKAKASGVGTTQASASRAYPCWDPWGGRAARSPA